MVPVKGEVPDNCDLHFYVVIAVPDSRTMCLLDVEGAYIINSSLQASVWGTVSKILTRHTQNKCKTFCITLKINTVW